MTQRVDKDKIEAIVGIKRQNLTHYARAVSKEQMVYILHSKVCLEESDDLNRCVFSRALNNGIDIDEWIQDAPVLVGVFDGHLAPIRIGT